MNILIANDDGISSPGIRLLAELASHIGTVYVAAPDAQCSAMSQKITIHSEILVRSHEIPYAKRAWSVSGSPADCVKVGIEMLLPEKPDIVFSGINLGYNAGFDIAYSGTIGAAKEAVMNRIPAIAYSSGTSCGMDSVREYFAPITEELLTFPFEPGVLWNVNFPDLPCSEIAGVRRNVTVAPQNMYVNTYVRAQLPDGSVSFRHGSRLASAAEVPDDSDVFFLLKHYVTVGRVYSEVL